MGAVGMPLGGSHNGGITVFKRKGIVVYSGAPPILFGRVRGRGIFDEEGRASKLRDNLYMICSNALFDPSRQFVGWIVMVVEFSGQPEEQWIKRESCGFSDRPRT